MQETGLVFARQVENISGSLGADIERLRTEPRVIGGAGRGGEVEQIIHSSQVEREANVLLHQGEAGVMAQTGQVGSTPGGEIVHPDYLVALGKKGLAQVRAEKAGGAGDQDTMSRQNTIYPRLGVKRESSSL
jgi:hypothetical protein